MRDTLDDEIRINYNQLYCEIILNPYIYTIYIHIKSSDRKAQSEMKS